MAYPEARDFDKNALILSMFFVFLLKNLRLIPLLALPFLAWLLPSEQAETQGDLSPEKVNLALRRTADGLLRLEGDSTSRIPAVKHYGEGIWRIRLEQPFGYDELPALLQESLDLYGVRRPYQVAVRRCDDETIELGYHQEDVEGQNPVACKGRDMPEGCHFIEITFEKTAEKTTFWAGKSWILLVLLGGLAGFYYFRRPRPKPSTPASAVEPDWVAFGNSRLDVAGQILLCGGVRQTLTFREAKLLHLFANNPDRLLEREEVLRQVWADEGVLVGRSVDVFVSRLRKKLAGDPSVGIVAVHGVGYRLETGKGG